MKLFISVALFFAIVISQAQTTTLDSLKKVLPDLENEQKLTTLFNILNELWAEDGRESLVYGNMACELSDQLNMPDKHANALIYIANAYDNMNNYDSSIFYYFKCIQLSEENKLKRNLSICYNNVGNMYKILQKPDEAKKYLLKSLVADSILQDTMGVIISYKNIGTVCKHQHDYPSALNYYKKALDKLEHLHPDQHKKLASTKANILTNIGNLYMNYITDTDTDPLQYYKQALVLREKSDDQYNRAITYQNIGYYYFKKKDYTKSEAYYQKAETIAIKISNAELLMGILKDKFEMYADRKMFSLAYSIYKDYAALHDSIFNEKSNRTISEIQIKYETEKKQKENALLKKDNEIKILQIESKNRVILFLIIGIIIIVLSFVLVFIQFAQKKKAFSSLAEKNLEIVEAEKDYDKNFRIIENKRKQSKEEHDDESQQLADKLVSYMIEEKPYLYSDISLEAVSQHLQTNRSYLSKVINEHFDQNFNGFINEYRIKTARQILANPDKAHLSIEGIGQMAGFNSMSTFFSSFKKYTGITPSFFRNTIK